MRIFDDKGIQVVQTFGQEDCDNVRMKYRRIISPSENFYDIRTEGTSKLDGIAARDNKLRKVDDHRNLARGRLTTHCLQVQGAKQIAVDEFESDSRLASL